MAKTTISVSNTGRPAPRWFRKFKKIWINTETAAIAILLAQGHGDGSLIILIIKLGTSWILENLETLLANGQDYVDTPQSSAYEEWDYVAYPSKSEFPSPGAQGVVYLDQSTDTDWVWSAEKNLYVRLDGDRPTKPPRIP